MKYKNKDGIELNYAGDDTCIRCIEQTTLVKEVVGEAIKMLGPPREYPHMNCQKTINFLRVNFDIKEDNIDG
tara:strand:+ start:739 stop:954 length:216 start_codon:yes stop_codon:yes gene_type:complete